jgi:5-(carboxyamino)imidazole ribonucleotide synthase
MTVLPNKIGILGGGQLGRMLALAGYPLGFQFAFFDPNPDSPAGHLAPLTIADYSDEGALEQFAASVDVVTLEFENVPTAAINLVSKYKSVFPNVRAVQTAQDRIQEKSLAEALKIPTPKFRAVKSKQELQTAVTELGLPAVLKTTRLGYDGKGQFVVRSANDIDSAWEQLGSSPLILEEFVSFEREVSQILVRDQQGLLQFYPLCENVHKNGVLYSTTLPAHDSNSLSKLAQQHASTIAEELQYVGVLAIEFFVRGNELLFNEMAPRVHNSGHWSIEGAVTSQFENHVRAVAGLPLGSTELRGPSKMFNLLGRAPKLSALCSVEGVHIHLYGKAPRPGRKIGHVTVVETNQQALELKAKKIEQLLVESASDACAQW